VIPNRNSEAQHQKDSRIEQIVENTERNTIYSTSLEYKNRIQMPIKKVNFGLGGDR